MQFRGFGAPDFRRQLAINADVFMNRGSVDL